MKKRKKIGLICHTAPPQTRRVSDDGDDATNQIIITRPTAFQMLFNSITISPYTALSFLMLLVHKCIEKMNNLFSPSIYQLNSYAVKMIKWTVARAVPVSARAKIDTVTTSTLTIHIYMYTKPSVYLYSAEIYIFLF